MDQIAERDIELLAERLRLACADADRLRYALSIEATSQSRVRLGVGLAALSVSTAGWLLLVLVDTDGLALLAFQLILLLVGAVSIESMRVSLCELIQAVTRSILDQGSNILTLNQRDALRHLATTPRRRDWRLIQGIGGAVAVAAFIAVRAAPTGGASTMTWSSLGVFAMLWPLIASRTLLNYELLAASLWKLYEGEDTLSCRDLPGPTRQG